MSTSRETGYYGNFHKNAALASRVKVKGLREYNNSAHSYLLPCEKELNYPKAASTEGCTVENPGLRACEKRFTVVEV